MVMVWVPTSAFAQTTIDPTGRAGESPGALKEEFQRPTPPPSPVLPLVPLPSNMPRLTKDVLQQPRAGQFLLQLWLSYTARLKLSAVGFSFVTIQSA
jgi:hypothetical protein